MSACLKEEATRLAQLQGLTLIQKSTKGPLIIVSYHKQIADVEQYRKRLSLYLNVRYGCCRDYRGKYFASSITGKHGISLLTLSP